MLRSPRKYASGKECEISTTEDEESNSETESENEENPMEKNKFWKRETKATSRAKQMKLSNTNYSLPNQIIIFITLM